MWKLFYELVREPLPAPQTEARWAAAMITSRAAECLKSIELLAWHGRERDAAVLVIVLLELRYDIAYVAQHPDMAPVWLSHMNEGRKPWKVRFLLEQLYPDAGERDAEAENYRRFSMVKHSNPAAGLNGFPVAWAPGSLNVRPLATPELTVAYLYAAAISCAAIAESAAACCVGASTSAAERALQSIRDADARLNAEMQRRMIEILEPYTSQGPQGS